MCIRDRLKTVLDAAPKAIADPNDYAARADLMWAGMLAHNNSCGVGREQDWASHQIEHELSAFYDCAHGAGLAVILPAWMEYVLPLSLIHIFRVAHRRLAVHSFQCDLTDSAATDVDRGLVAASADAPDDAAAHGAAQQGAAQGQGLSLIHIFQAGLLHSQLLQKHQLLLALQLGDVLLHLGADGQHLAVLCVGNGLQDVYKRQARTWAGRSQTFPVLAPPAAWEPV